MDPRHFQITVLSGLILYGLTMLDFEVRAGHVLVIGTTALATQWLGDRLCGRPFNFKSPWISALSLCLLLRASSLWIAALAAALTIGSKFVLRVRGKHVFNPTNFGIVALLVLSPILPGGAWVSSGQWGSGAFFTFLLASAGFVVVRRATRSDVTWAFLAAYVGIVLGRALWLGDPWAVPLHRLHNGTLLVFAFLMISDPKTTPDSRTGRVVFAALVAAVGAVWQFWAWEPDGLLFALAAAAPTVPLLDRLFPARRYRWPGALTTDPTRKEPSMSTPRRLPQPLTGGLPAAVLAFLLLWIAGPAQAFCGFYVARAETDLFNRASQVVLVRDGNKTVLTMASDFDGAPSEFAVVIPVPTFLEREQIHVAHKALIDHLDAYTAPRLVEYHDPNPCHRYELQELGAADAIPRPRSAQKRAKNLGVTVEATYTVGEYDISILSAEESRGLVIWLEENGYRIPQGAEPVVGSYLKQGMRFFVAKVNLEEHGKLGYRYLRPLQVAYESPKFLLPIRLGTVNADGPQDLFVYALTRTGRVETTNYRTVKLPTGMDLPVFVKDDFADFYRDLFARQVEEHDMRVVFLEYAWDMAWCDPCAADPLSPSELRDLGVFWVDPRQGGPARDVFVTRLHVRYDREHFPTDLQFQETSDRTNFQGRYVLRHPWQGGDTCPAADRYLEALRERQRQEARTLAELTGWDLGTIRDRMGLTTTPEESLPWWKKLWGR